MIALELVIAILPTSLACVALAALFVVVVRISDRNVSAEGFAETYLLDRDQHYDDNRDAMQGKREGRDE